MRVLGSVIFVELFVLFGRFCCDKITGNRNYQCNSVSIDYKIYQVDKTNNRFERIIVLKLLPTKVFKVCVRQTF